MDLERPPTAKRILSARQHAGLSKAEVAQRIGITPESYDHLERDDAEAFMAISLAELRSLGALLRVSVRGLVSKDNAPEVPRPVGVAELVDRLRNQISAADTSVEDFSEQVGWDISSVLDDPDRLWPDWNVDCLQDVCAAVGIDWRAVLPE